jgi:hypothetical protein
MTATTEDCAQENCAKDKWADRIIAVDLEFSEAEEAMLTAKAAQKGLTLEEYVRTLLGYPP